MKKKVIIAVISVVIALALIGGGTFAYASNVAKKNSIGLDKALNIAMIDAGVNESNATVTKAKMDFEKGIFIYDIEFVSDSNIEYDYKIKASDGTILERDEELEDDLTTVAKTKPGEKTTSTTAQAENDKKPSASEAAPSNSTTAPKKETTVKDNNSADISLAEAKSIALSNAGVSSKDAKFTSAHKEYDDGINYYEIDFVTSDYEYEYEISIDGKVISYDRDKISAKPAKTTESNVSRKFIGVDKAKEIALKNAGLSADEVRFKKAKLDRDDGLDLYEIEFVCDGVEYEYEINAKTGKIYSHSNEIDD